MSAAVAPRIEAVAGAPIPPDSTTWTPGWVRRTSAARSPGETETLASHDGARDARIFGWNRRSNGIAFDHDFNRRRGRNFLRRIGAIGVARIRFERDGDQDRCSQGHTSDSRKVCAAPSQVIRGQSKHLKGHIG